MQNEERTDVSHTRVVVNRYHQTTHELLVRDTNNFLYNVAAFERRFRLNKA